MQKSSFIFVTLSCFQNIKLEMVNSHKRFFLCVWYIFNILAHFGNNWNLKVHEKFLPWKDFDGAS